MKKIPGLIKGYLIISGALVNLFLIWMIAGLPIYLDRILVRSELPADSDYIVCIAGGIGGGNLPTEDGWQRIYTAVQLYSDGYARKIIISGGGTEAVSEAEIYSEAARWLGCPQDSIICEPGAHSTAEHPANILRIKGRIVSLDSRLTIVTTPLHSMRVALCFKKAGFTDFRMVTAYTARKFKDPSIVRELRTSKLAEYHPSAKSYNDVFNRLKWRSNSFLTSMRELGALVVYKMKRYI